MSTILPTGCHRVHLAGRRCAPSTVTPDAIEWHRALAAPLSAPWWSANPEGVRLRIRVVPGARRTEIVGVINDELRIRLAARPIDDAANDELVRLLSDVSQLRRSAIRIVRGRTSRSKVVQLVGRDVPPDELRG